MKNFFRPILIITKSNILRFFRDKVYIFFMLILPVMFLLIFGMIYGNNFAAFDIAIFNESSEPLAAELVGQLTADEEIIRRAEVADRNEAEEKMIRGEIDAIVTLPAGFGAPGANSLPTGQVAVSYSKNAEQAGQTIGAVMEEFAAGLNQAITGETPLFTVETSPLERDGLTTFDYVFAGLLGYTVMTVGMLGVANNMPGDKETGALKRIRATTITSGQIIAGYALTFLLVGIITFAIMIALGLLVFDFQMRGSWLTFGVFIALGTMMMLGFGLAIGGAAKNEAQASAGANLLMFPMMFLSGVFFPMFMMPTLVQNIAQFIPLTPIVDGVRLIITENYGLLELLPQLGFIAAWGVIIYIIAIRFFRWE